MHLRRLLPHDSNIVVVLLVLFALVANGCLATVEDGLQGTETRYATPQVGPSTVSVNSTTSRIEKNGLSFISQTSRPSAFSVPSGSKIALLHDDQDEVDKHVRLVMEQAIFDIKSINPKIVVVERSGIEDLLKEHNFQSRGFVRDQELARLGHFLGLDYVAVFNTSYPDSNKLYGQGNYIDAWEVLVPLKILDVNTAEVVFSCTSTTRAMVGRSMKASQVLALNREALAIGATKVGECLAVSVNVKTSDYRR